MPGYEDPSRSAGRRLFRGYCPRIRFSPIHIHIIVAAANRKKAQHQNDRGQMSAI